MSVQGGMGTFEKYVRMTLLFILIGGAIVLWWLLPGEFGPPIWMKVAGTVVFLVVGGVYYERLMRA